MRLRSHKSPSKENSVKIDSLKVKCPVSKNQLRSKSAMIFTEVPTVRTTKPKRRCQIFNKTPTNNCEPLQNFVTPKKCKISTFPGRKSFFRGWKRAFTKFSPSTETTVSPLKAAITNLQGSIFRKDSYVNIFTWVVNMSEQFFYDNALLLLNSAKSDTQLVKRYLRHNFKQIDLKFFKNLINIGFLGKGNYGSVYSGTDRLTRKNYAIKYIAPQSDDLIKHCENILEYMAERNSIIRAMNSPFIMAFFYSLKIKNIGGLFLIFEFCVGDLSIFIKRISYDDFKEISRRLYNNEKETIQELDNGINVLGTSLMYIFEIFCALDFLVRSNIIHQDIKPENLMISETFHLKVGDFGLVYRTRTVHRMTNNLLLKHSEIDKIESSNYDLSIDGTYEYEDLEIKLMELEDTNNPLFDEVINNDTKFDTKSLRYDEEILVPSFLTDTWSAGIVCIKLLFRGFHIFDPTNICHSILTNVPRTDLNDFLVHVVGRKALYNKYIHKGLINAGWSQHKELMEFIASIFRPRETRSHSYTKTKFMYQYTKRINQNYIDFDKFEKIKSFRERDFSSKNIFTLQVPENIRSIFSNPITTKFLKFEDLLESLTGDSSGFTVIDMKPGLTINYFH